MHQMVQEKEGRQTSREMKAAQHYTLAVHQPGISPHAQHAHPP